MSIYTISDIHGCYDEFMALLEQIQFNPEHDTLYVLGDVVDRGEKPLDCLRYIMRTKNVHFLLGNHEDMMLAYYDDPSSAGAIRWYRNGYQTTLAQFNELSETERCKILAFIKKSPLYKTVKLKDRRYFLSHAGLDPSKSFNKQTSEDLTWSRKEFYSAKALDKYSVIFGHNITPFLRESMNEDKHDCSIWFDKTYSDKICIDGGCVYGGALIALRLDDEAVFYVKSSRGEQAAKMFFKS